MYEENGSVRAYNVQEGVEKVFIAYIIYVATTLLTPFPVIGKLASLAGIAAFVLLLMGKYKMYSSIPAVKVSFILDIIGLPLSIIFLFASSVYVSATGKMPLGSAMRLLIISTCVLSVFSLISIFFFFWPLGSFMEKQNKTIEAKVCKAVVIITIAIYAVYIACTLIFMDNIYTVDNDTVVASTLWSFSGSAIKFINYALSLFACKKVKDTL